MTIQLLLALFVVVVVFFLAVVFLFELRLDLVELLVEGGPDVRALPEELPRREPLQSLDLLKQLPPVTVDLPDLPLVQQLLILSLLTTFSLEDLLLFWERRVNT